MESETLMATRRALAFTGCRTRRGQNGERVATRVTLAEQVGERTKYKVIPFVTRHGARGFDWGEPNAGAADLAYAILLETLGERYRSIIESIYMDFRDRVLVEFHIDKFYLFGNQIRRVAREIYEEKRDGQAKT